MAGLTGRALIASRCAKFFKDGDFVCDDKEINDVLAYNKITRDDTENNQ